MIQIKGHVVVTVHSVGTALNQSSKEKNAMQFQMTSCHVDAAKLAAAMQPFDPAARITVDSAHDRLEVISSATAEQVQGVLDELGCSATPLDKEVHISGGSTCCGGCS
ncbi:MAG: hypothetical protein WBP11_12490 [Dokdonella sp.]